MAARTFRWRGASSGAWNNPANWVDGSEVAWGAGNYPGSSAPDSDTVLFDKALASGAHSPSGYDGSSAPGAIAKLRIGIDYTGGIGSALTPVTYDWDTVSIDAPFSQPIYLAGKATTNTNINIVRANTVGLSGEWATVRILRGVVGITSGKANNIVLSYISSPQSDAQLTIASAVGVINLFEIFAGQLVCNQGTSTANMGFKISGGKVTLAGPDAPPFLEIYGGVLDWQSGNIGNIYARGGIITVENGSSARTYDFIEMYAGSIVRLDNGLYNVTDAQSGIVKYGGDLSAPPGVTYTVV
ncbi:MAG: hypothetical protein IT209_00790 [Armatimonadetes bacterium]|nr:hypothetical protein [Armatimonadota bacterium]